MTGYIKSKSKSNIDYIKNNLSYNIKSLHPLLVKLRDTIDEALPKLPDQYEIFEEIKQYCIYLADLYRVLFRSYDNDLIDKCNNLQNKIEIIQGRIYNLIFNINEDNIYDFV